MTEKRRAPALGPGRDHYEPPVSVSFWQSRSWRPAARSAGESVALHCQWQWLSAADLVRLGVTVTVTVGPAGGPAAATVLAGPGTDSEFLDAGATDCQLELQEHIYVISTGYTLNKILIIYIYLVYPTPTFCLRKWVELVGWCRIEVWRWTRPRRARHSGRPRRSGPGCTQDGLYAPVACAFK